MAATESQSVKLIWWIMATAVTVLCAVTIGWGSRTETRLERLEEHRGMVEVRLVEIRKDTQAILDRMTRMEGRANR
jgi:hypothetical protein